MAVQIETDSSLTLGNPEMLFEGPYYEGNLLVNVGRTFDISADDARFLMIRRVDETGQRLSMVLNWHEELLEHVPVP